MLNVKFRASRCTLTSHAGLSIIGQCFENAGVDSTDGLFPTTRGMRVKELPGLAVPVHERLRRHRELSPRQALPAIADPAKGVELRDVAPTIGRQAPRPGPPPCCRWPRH